MSAFVVDKQHIDVLVRLTQHCRDFSWRTGPPNQPGVIRRYARGNEDRVGQMLVDQCVRSVSYRYDSQDNLPGPIDEYYRLPYTFSTVFRYITPVEGLKAIDCYEYQSCETDDWEETEACAFCRALRDCIITHLPGYDDAPWNWGSEDL